MNKNADYAIALKVRKLKHNEEIDESCSKFYGSPTLPKELLNNCLLYTSPSPRD